MMSSLVLDWLANYALHSAVLLSAAWLFVRHPLVKSLHIQEAIWRTALFAGLLTATLHASGFTYGAFTKIDSAVITGASPSAPNVLPTRTDVAVPAARVPSRISPQSSAPAMVIDWQAILVAAYASVAILLLTRFAVARTRLRRSLRGRKALTAGTLCETLYRLQRRAGEVRLSVSDRINGPIAFGTARKGEICVPPRVLTMLNAAQQKALLAHEYAHLRRRDTLWIAAYEIVTALAWIQPLNALAKRRLRALSEMHCDDWAYATVSDGPALASCLTEVASWLDNRPAPRFAAAMAELRSPLGMRVDRLLNDQTSRPTASTFVRYAASAATLAAAYAFAPVVGIAQSPDAVPVSNPAGVTAAQALQPLNVPPKAAEESLDTLTQYRDGWHSLLSSVDIRARGAVDIRLEDGGRATLEGLEAGGSLELDERSGIIFRSVTVENDESGALRYAFSKTGMSRDFDADAQRWFQKHLYEAVRHGPLGAEAILDNVYERGGFDESLEYIHSLTKPWPKSVYYELLLRRPGVTLGQADRLLQDAAAALEGDDWALGTFLSSTVPILQANPPLAASFATALANIEEAWARRDAFGEVLDATKPPAGLLLPAIDGLDDGDKSWLLLQALPAYLNDAALTLEFLRATRTVDGEDARRSLLIETVQAGANSANFGALVRDVLDETARLNSASKRADVLKWIGRLTNERAAESYLDAVGEISSDRLRRRALTWFLQREDMPAALMQRAAELS